MIQVNKEELLNEIMKLKNLDEIKFPENLKNDIDFF
jgi:hypothetical protein